MAASPPMAKCRTHPANLAGWTCDACGASLCPQCVAEERYSSTIMESCSRCGGRALVLKHHRSQRPYASRLVDSARFMMRPSTLLSIVALGLFCSVTRWVGGCLGWVLAASATWSYLFYAFLAASRGKELDVPDFSSISDLTSPLARGLVSSLYVWLPAVLYAVLIREDAPDSLDSPLFMDPIFLLILGWGLFYGPIAFMVAASDSPLLHLLNPVALVGWVFKLGSNYFIALGVVGGSLLLGVGLDMLGGGIQEMKVPLVSRFLPEMLSLIMPFFMSHVLGLLLYVHGDKVGYGLEDDYYEPALPGATPQGKLPGKAPAQSAPAAQGTAGARRAAMVASGEPPEQVAQKAVAQELGEALRAVADAVAAKDAAGAVQAYMGLHSSEFSKVSQEQHLFVGRAAVGTGDMELAAKAFETAADVAPNSPLAPQALVLLARLCAERMKDPARATSVYRYIVHRYPNTDASRFAAQRLGPSA